MGVTGWIAEEPEEAPRMPVTALLMAGSRRGQQPGAVLAQSLARAAAEDAREARRAAASAPDPDERAANLIAGGYQPGLIFQLSQRLGDTQAELEAEQDKLEKAAKRSQRLSEMHQRGQIDVPGLVARMQQDTDDGDPDKVERLRRRAASLGRQIAEAQELMRTPQDRQQDAFEAATSRAQRILAEVDAQVRAQDKAEAASRAQLARDRREFYAARGRRPFASPGAAADDGWERERALRTSMGEGAANLVSYR